jgi:hypothetical protein
LESFDNVLVVGNGRMQQLDGNLTADVGALGSKDGSNRPHAQRIEQLEGCCRGYKLQLMRWSGGAGIGHFLGLAIGMPTIC